jgi:uncharacterized protein CbrC (UPF0167 family)
VSKNEFSVFWYDPDGNYHRELSYVDAKTAVEFAHDFVKRPAGLLGIIQRVIITDGGDFCVFEWKYGKGVTYPEKVKE